MEIRNYKELLKKITTIFLDVDGVLTDGTVIVAEDGEQLRNVNVKDGYVLQLAVKKGYRIVIISGGKSKYMTKRFEYLGINDVFLGVVNKIECFIDYIKAHQISAENCMYIGDDIPDYKVMQEVAVACCPLDAAEEIKNISHYVSHLKGGRGCVRDIIEQVLKARGDWFDTDSFSW